MTAHFAKLRVAFGAVTILGLLGVLGATRIADQPRVKIDTGTLQGVVDSASGVLVFRGIPYAAPPVGELRWRPPQSPAKWSGVRDASKLKTLVATEFFTACTRPSAKANWTEPPACQLPKMPRVGSLGPMASGKPAPALRPDQNH